MANRPGHRRFGSVRKLPSGRYQASYLGPDGRRRTAPETLDRKKDADLYLSRVESVMSQGEWTDPLRAKIRLGDYAERWVRERAGLRPRTIELYRWLLGKHIVPMLGPVPLGTLTTPMIRNWRADLLESGCPRRVPSRRSAPPPPPAPTPVGRPSRTG